ncbi:DUF4352 domain-containing protein [Nocardiopsis flavescens]
MSYGPPTGGYHPPPGGGQYPPPGGQPPKQGMSTGAKVGLFGCGGCLVLVALGFVLLLVLGAFAASGDSGTPEPAAPAPSEEASAAQEDAPAEEAGGITMTATHAGTAGDIVDDTVYTVIDIEIVNDGDADLDVNPMYFTVTLEDGTAASEWGDTLFADIDALDAVTLRPGERVSGQIAVVGEVDVASVRMEELMGLGEDLTADVR